MNNPNDTSGQLTGSPSEARIEQSGPECSRAFPRSQGAALAEQRELVERCLTEARWHQKDAEKISAFILKQWLESHERGLVELLDLIGRRESEVLHSASRVLSEPSSDK